MAHGRHLLLLQKRMQPIEKLREPGNMQKKREDGTLRSTGRRVLGGGSHPAALRVPRRALKLPMSDTPKPPVSIRALQKNRTNKTNERGYCKELAYAIVKAGKLTSVGCASRLEIPGRGAAQIQK